MQQMENGNKYLLARRKAAETNERLCSREKTAELLGVSPSTLANYELDVTKTVPPDAVVMMADLYGAPELKCWYCAHDCPIGRGMPIPTQICRIELIAVKVFKTISEGALESLSAKLLEISAAGRLTRENRADIIWLISHIDSVTELFGELKLSCQKLLSAGEANGKR